MKKILLLSLLACILTACSYIKKHTVVGDQANAYRSATADQPLQVPTTVSQSGIGSSTETLPTEGQATALTRTPLPPGSLAEQVATGKAPKSALNYKLPKVK